MAAAAAAVAQAPAAAGRLPPRSGFLARRIVHLHPTRLCNLACSHCYSHSGPRQRGALGIGPILQGLALLRREGYEQVSLSGGEPLVYPDLLPLIEGAQALGLRVTMVSNGLLVDDRMEAVLSRLDGLAISFDGLQPTHDAVRGRDDAYAKACAAVRHQADRGRPAAAAISLVRDGLPELPDLVAELVECGAHAIQVRPVARAGRAVALPARCFYSDADQARMFLVVNALRQERPGLPIHCDLVPAGALWRQREDYAALLAACADGAGAGQPLAALVNPLVITDDGVVKPVAYDFAPRFDIGALASLDEEGLRRYAATGVAGLRALVGHALAALADHQGFVDWFDHLTRLSEAAQPPAARSTR